MTRPVFHFPVSDSANVAAGELDGETIVLAGGVPFLENEGCRYIIGKSNDHVTVCCGLDRGKRYPSYCDYHAALCLEPRAASEGEEAGSNSTRKSYDATH